MFSDDEVAQCDALMSQPVQPTGTDDLRRATVRRIMERTAELLAARGGTMTEERLVLIRDHHAPFATKSDDSALVMECLGHITAQGARIAALEAEVADRTASLEQAGASYRKAVGERERALQHVSELEKSLENARQERDEVLRTGKQFETDARKHFEQSCANLQRAEKAESQRDAALADNAALLHLVCVAAGERGPLAACWACGGGATHGPNCRFGAALEAPHPGAALLERLKRLEEALENAQPFEALHADLSAQLRAAWEATGVSGTVKGMTTLADVVGVQRADLLSARERADASEKVLSELADIIRAHVAKRKREAH